MKYIVECKKCHNVIDTEQISGGWGDTRGGSGISIKCNNCGYLNLIDTEEFDTEEDLK